MLRNTSHIWVLVAALLVSGCSGKLDVTDSKGMPIAGIPIATYELWIEEGVYTTSAKGGACDTSTPFQKVSSLPTGAVYYVRVEGSMFSKTTLDAKLNSDGALAELSFDNESNVPDTLTATSNLLKTLPSLGVAGAGAPPAGPLPACDSGEVLKKITKYSDWLLAH